MSEKSVPFKSPNPVHNRDWFPYVAVAVLLVAAFAVWKMGRDQARFDDELKRAGCSVVKTTKLNIGDGGVERTWRCPDGTEFVHNW